MGRCAIMNPVVRISSVASENIRYNSGTQADNQEEDIKNEMPPVR